MNYYSPNVFLDLSKSQTCCYRHLQNVFYAVMTNQRSLLWRSSTKESKAKDEKKETNKQTEPTKQKSLEILETQVTLLKVVFKIDDHSENVYAMQQIVNRVKNIILELSIS